MLNAEHRLIPGSFYKHIHVFYIHILEESFKFNNGHKISFYIWKKVITYYLNNLMVSV